MFAGCDFGEVPSVPSCKGRGPHTTYPDATTFVTREYLEVGGDQPGALWGDRIPEETVCGSKSGQLGEEGTEDTGVVMQGCSSPGRCHPCHWGL